MNDAVEGWVIPNDVTGCMVRYLDLVSFVRFALTSKRTLELLEDQSLWCYFYLSLFQKTLSLPVDDAKMLFKGAYQEAFLSPIYAQREREKQIAVKNTLKSFYKPFGMFLTNRMWEGIGLLSFSLFFILLPLVMTSSISLHLSALSLFIVVYSVQQLLAFTISVLAALTFNYKGLLQYVEPFHMIAMCPKGFFFFAHYPLLVWVATKFKDKPWNKFMKLMMEVVFLMLCYIGFVAFSVSFYMCLNFGYPSGNLVVVFLLVAIISLTLFVLLHTSLRIDNLYLILFVIFLSMFIVDSYHYLSTIPTIPNSTNPVDYQIPNGFPIYPYILFSLILLYGIHSTLKKTMKSVRPLLASQSSFLKALVILFGASGIAGYATFLRGFSKGGWMRLFSYEVYWFIWVLWGLLYMGWVWTFIMKQYAFGFSQQTRRNCHFLFSKQ